LREIAYGDSNADFALMKRCRYAVHRYRLGVAAIWRVVPVGNEQLGIPIPMNILLLDYIPHSPENQLTFEAPIGVDRDTGISTDGPPVGVPNLCCMMVIGRKDQS
jgi:hypothetical protein